MEQIRVEDLTELQKEVIKEKVWESGMSAQDPCEMDDTDVSMFLNLYNQIHMVLFQNLY